MLPDPANSLRMSLGSADTEVCEQWSPRLSAGCSAAPPVLQKGLSQQHYPCYSAGGCSCCVFVCLQSCSERVAAQKGAWSLLGAGELSLELNSEAFPAALAVLAGRLLFWLLAAPSVAPVPAGGTSKCLNFPSFVAVCNPLYQLHSPEAELSPVLKLQWLSVTSSAVAQT